MSVGPPAIMIAAIMENCSACFAVLSLPVSPVIWDFTIRNPLYMMTSATHMSAKGWSCFRTDAINPVKLFEPLMGFSNIQLYLTPFVISV